MDMKKMRVVSAMLKTGNTVCTPSANSLSHMAVKTTARSPQWDQHSKKCLRHFDIQELFWKVDPGPSAPGVTSMPVDNTVKH